MSHHQGSHGNASGNLGGCSAIQRAAERFQDLKAIGSTQKDKHKGAVFLVLFLDQRKAQTSDFAKGVHLGEVDGPGLSTCRKLNDFRHL
jgi:hypothetical protein